MIRYNLIDLQFLKLGMGIQQPEQGIIHHIDLGA